MKFLKTTWQNVRRSPYQALAAILIMTLTFLVVSFFSFVFLGSSKIIKYFESRPQVTVFFKDEAKQADIDKLRDQILSTGKISSVKFISKEQALKIYKEQNKNDPLLLELVTADILPSSLEISTSKIEDLASISETLKGSSFIQEVVFQKDVVATLTSWTNAARTIGIGLVSVFSLVSVFIILTIVGIKVSQKREDIEIMRLVGAGSWYVRWPFILEGMFYGAIGSVVGWAVASGVLLYSTPLLSSLLKGIPLLPVSPIFLLELLGIELLLAVFLGALATYIAVLRYLK